jgi:hypothetical protein
MPIHIGSNRSGDEWRQLCLIGRRRVNVQFRVREWPTEPVMDLAFETSQHARHEFGIDAGLDRPRSVLNQARVLQSQTDRAAATADFKTTSVPEFDDLGERSPVGAKRKEGTVLDRCTL